jgi:hypothetical protein
MMKNMLPLYACKMKGSDMYLNHRNGWFVELDGVSHSHRTGQE